MAIVAGIISAFLQHQFAKERQEQAQQAQEQQAKEASQARLQQALQMREIMGEQIKAKQEIDIADRQSRQSAQLQLREMMGKEALETRKQMFQQNLESRTAQHQMSLKEFETKANITDKLMRSRAEQNRKAQTTATLERETLKRTMLPVPGKDLTNFVDIRGRSPLELTRDITQLTPAKLAESGFRYLPEIRKRAFDASLIGLTQLRRIREQGLTLFAGIQPGQNLINYAKLKGKAFLADPAVRAFEALVNETLPTSAIASGLTPGRLGTQIIERIERPVMPDLSESWASLDIKLKVIEQRMRNNLAVHFGLGIPADLVGGMELGGQPGGQGGQPGPTEPEGLDEALWGLLGK